MERPDPIRYPCQWIPDELSQSNNPHPQWWREIRATGKLNTRARGMQWEHNDHTTQHYGLWKVTAFRLPLSQQEAPGWWDSPPAIHGLCPQDFCPPSSDPQNFWAIFQENTLALARVLQVCTDASGAKPGVLCRAVRELQQYMALLMTINGDNVMEASLLGPVEEEPRPPTPKEEATLLGGGARTSGDSSPVPQQGKNARCTELARWTTAPFTFMAPHHSPSLEREKSWKGIDIDPNNTSMWVCAYLKKDSQLLEWWQDFRPLPHIADECH